MPLDNPRGFIKRRTAMNKIKIIGWMILFIFLMGCEVTPGVSNERYELDFILDGGSTTQDTHYVFNEVTTFKLFTPIKDDAIFVGWEYDGKIINDDEIVVDKNITLKAIWKNAILKITFDYKYDNKKEELNLPYGSSLSFPQIEERTGYRFVGWSLSGSIIDEDYVFEKDAYLEARWLPNTYKVTYILQDEIYKEVEIKYDENLILEDVNIKGYNFLGWYKDTEKIENQVFKFNTNITLIGKVEPKTYQVTLKDNEKIIDTLYVKYLEKVSIENPQKEGYEFLGWYLNNMPFTLETWPDEDLVLESKWKLLQEETLITSIEIKLYNKQSDPYDVVSLYDSTTSVSLTKYWHKIGIKKINNVYKITKVVPSGSPLSEVGSYDYLLLMYQAYPNFNEIKEKVKVGQIIKFQDDLNNLTTGSINLMAYVYEVTKLPPSKEEVNSYLNDLYKDITTVSEDLNLIPTYQDYDIIWKTSNKDVISETGIYHKPSVTREVTLQAYIENELMYEFKVKVVGAKDQSSALATGYFYTNFSKITENTIASLDIMYCAFGYIDENGNFTNTSETSNLIKNIKNYVLPLAKKHGTKVLISVNEKNNSFSSVSQTPELRKKLSENVVSLINTYDLDGIDIDWEYPDADEVTNFTLLMQEIYNAVKKNNPNHLVTAAIGGGKWQPPRYDLSNSKNYLDYINLMTYSMTSSHGYFQNALYKSSKGYTLTSCSIDESIKIYDTYNVPHEKILVGVAFYGIKEENCEGPGTSSDSGKSISYRVLYDTYIKNQPDNVQILYDEESESAYIYDSLNKVFITYDSERSIARKCEYINTHNLAGIMYWQDGHDADDILLNAIKENIRK